MGLILSGHADVLRQTFGGREVWLTNLDPGDLVGVGPAMAAKPSAIWVIARGPVVMSTLPSATFFALAQRHGALSVAALSMFSRHFIGIAERLTLLLTASVSERLLACLATLGTVDEDRGERSILRDLPSVTRLAMLIHASREATSRALSELKRDGLVGTDGQAWWVVIPRDRPLDPWGQ